MGGPEALQLAVTRSGFAAAFSLIFISEIGDKVSMAGGGGRLSLILSRVGIDVEFELKLS